MPGLRLPIGPPASPQAGDIWLSADGLVCQPSSTVVKPADWLSPLNSSEISITGTTTLNSTAFGNTHLISGTSGNYDITLPAVSGNTGKRIHLRVDVWASANKLYTIKDESAVTVVRLVHTNFVVLRCTGSGWLIEERNLESPWLQAGTVTVTAVTTDPTKATTVATDEVWWRRRGPMVEIQIKYYQAAGTGGGAGSGDYLFALPFSLTWGPSVTVFTGTINNGVVSAFPHTAVIEASNESQGMIAPYDTTRFRILLAPDTGGNYFMSSGNYDFATKLAIASSFAAPINEFKDAA
jgi:hypothetical protein